jgi:hypothetical protein
MRRTREAADEEEEGLGRRIRQRLAEPAGRVAWDAMLPEMQNEVIWIMQRLARSGQPEWITALAMLRRTSQREWHRTIPSLPELGLTDGVPKIQSVGDMLAAPLRSGDGTLFLELLAWRRTKGKRDLDDSSVCDTIAQAMGYHGNPAQLDVLDSDDKARLDPVDIIHGLCERGTNVDWFKELIAFHAPDVRIVYHCALYGRLEWLIYAKEKDCPWNKRTCDAAAAGGHLDVLRYAHEAGCPWDVGTCEAAAEGGHLVVLQYAHEAGCPLDVRTCDAAAKGGHLETLLYAHEHGCPWTTWTCAWAARNGHLATLRYLHEHDCPWDRWTCQAAAGSGDLATLRYAVTQECPMFWPTIHDVPAYYSQAIRDYLATVLPAQ